MPLLDTLVLGENDTTYYSGVGGRKGMMLISLDDGRVGWVRCDAAGKVWYGTVTATGTSFGTPAEVEIYDCGPGRYGSLSERWSFQVVDDNLYFTLHDQTDPILMVVDTTDGTVLKAQPFGAIYNGWMFSDFRPVTETGVVLVADFGNGFMATQAYDWDTDTAGALEMYELAGDLGLPSQVIWSGFLGWGTELCLLVAWSDGTDSSSWLVRFDDDGVHVATTLVHQTTVGAHGIETLAYATAVPGVGAVFYDTSGWDGTLKYPYVTWDGSTITRSPGYVPAVSPSFGSSWEIEAQVAYAVGPGARGIVDHEREASPYRGTLVLSDGSLAGWNAADVAAMAGHTEGDYLLGVAFTGRKTFVWHGPTGSGNILDPDPWFNTLALYSDTQIIPCRWRQRDDGLGLYGPQWVGQYGRASSMQMSSRRGPGSYR